MPIFSLEIKPYSNTSKPSRSGILTRLSLLNASLPFSFFITSVIKSLAALLPMSMAANFNILSVYFVMG
jgi:hypothetical protein